MPDSRTRLLVITGSLRRASFNRMVAQTLPELVATDVEIALHATLGDIPLYDQDTFDAGLPDGVARLAEAVFAADGVVIVTPEYNYSVPGALKNALDWLSRLPGKPMGSRPVALQSASMGMLGGVRAQYHLRQVLVALDARVMNLPEVMIGQVQNKVDADAGRLIDGDAREHIRRQLDAFVRFIRR